MRGPGSCGVEDKCATADLCSPFDAYHVPANNSRSLVQLCRSVPVPMAAWLTRLESPMLPTPTMQKKNPGCIHIGDGM